MPDNFFVDETPAEPTTPSTAEVTSKKSKNLKSRTSSNETASDGPTDSTARVNADADARADNEENAQKSKPSAGRAGEMTFEEEWKFGGGGGSENSGKSGDLKADGDAITRRVKRGPRKSKKTSTTKSGVSQGTDEQTQVSFYKNV